METVRKTEYVTVDASDCRSLPARAGEIIRRGGLVVFPTETVYGLGGDATCAESARRIYAAKGRPSDTPLIIHISEPKQADAYAHVCPTYDRLARAFMPGPLTVILPRKDTIPKETTGGLETVAVRCPSHPIAQALIRAAGVPIAAPSANLSGKPSPTCAAHVAEDMNGRVDMILDSGNCEIGLESTIVSVDGDDHITLLRPGAITYDALCMVCDDVRVADAVLNRLAENERPLSPGMKYRHYAPTSPVVLLKGAPDRVLAFLCEAQKKEHCAILCYDEEVDALADKMLIPIGARTDIDTQAKRLFRALRQADETDAEIIYAHFPTPDGLGLALCNRLIRAAAHTVKEID
jgi:L-threonylcarbamoyladenylate synthase